MSITTTWPNSSALRMARTTSMALDTCRPTEASICTAASACSRAGAAPTMTESPIAVTRVVEGAGPCTARPLGSAGNGPLASARPSRASDVLLGAEDGGCGSARGRELASILRGTQSRPSGRETGAITGREVTALTVSIDVTERYDGGVICRRKATTTIVDASSRPAPLVTLLKDTRGT